jgi:heme/copper-type cytochrome/quinol oxidase subunit 2
MLQEVMLIIVTIIVAALWAWIFTPIAYNLFITIRTTMTPLVPEETQTQYNQAADLFYTMILNIGFIVIGVVAYYIWTVMQRRRAEDIIG